MLPFRAPHVRDVLYCLLNCRCLFEIGLIVVFVLAVGVNHEIVGLLVSTGHSSRSLSHRKRGGAAAISRAVRRHDNGLE